LSGGRYSVAADIYSFGVVLSEFDSHEIPYNDLRDPLDGHRLGNFAIITRVREGTLRPVFSSSCPRNIVDIAEQCLASNPSDRPTSYQLSVILKKLTL
ncbi:kinase, partial [Thraustotheca clavata]